MFEQNVYKDLKFDLIKALVNSEKSRYTFQGEL